MFSLWNHSSVFVNGHKICLKGRLGRRSRNKVYRGILSQTNEPVALKESSFNETNPLKSTICFAQSMAEIGSYIKLSDCPRVARLYDYELNMDEKRARLVMELCNENLYKHSLSRRGFRLNMSLWYSMVLAVNEVHERDIIHADIKPENFVFGNDGNVKLIDFGYSITVKPQPSFNYYRGTLPYVSPEVLAHRYRIFFLFGLYFDFEYSIIKPYGMYSTKCDVWALGCILYEMVYGEPYISNGIISTIFNSDKVVLNKMARIKFPKLEDLDLFDLLYKCMSLSPCLRLSTGEILEHRFMRRARRVFDIENIH
ncbi:hypothetical protein ACOME3_000958 [Neoechinorhynchus agilis]